MASHPALSLRSSLWKLDLCTTVLPQIEKLLQSKYERYEAPPCPGAARVEVGMCVHMPHLWRVPLALPSSLWLWAHLL